MKPESKPDIVELARVLNQHNVRWVLVGGMALILHGGHHVTTDCDLAFEKVQGNLESIKTALERLGARPQRAPEQGEFPLDFSILMAPFMHLKSEVGDIDLINRLPGIDSFNGLYERAVEVEIIGERVRVASIEDLIAMKSTSERPKDREHIEELKSLLSLSEENPKDAP